WGSESGFPTKTAALAYGREQESRVRRGDWTDPKSAETRLTDFIDRYLEAVDAAPGTISKQESHRRCHILPRWGGWAAGRPGHGPHGDQGLDQRAPRQIPLRHGRLDFPDAHGDYRHGRGGAAHPRLPLPGHHHQHRRLRNLPRARRHPRASAARRDAAPPAPPPHPPARRFERVRPVPDGEIGRAHV